MTRVAIIGGGPGGYEAALVARQLGGEVTIIERDGIGGSAVLTDCVPSKTLIATAEVLVRIEHAKEIGLTVAGGSSAVGVDYQGVGQRILKLAAAQSKDIANRLHSDGIRVISGRGRLDGPNRVVATTESGEEIICADIVLLATGTSPRELADAPIDGERILNWKQLYSLGEVPSRLIVVGSGVTGVEFAGAMHALGSEVVLVSSRAQVLPGEDPDAAAVLQKVYSTRGMEIMSECRAVAARRAGDAVVVSLADGREVEGSHALFAVGAIPNTAGLGLETVQVKTTESGHIPVDRVSRTNVANIYAAGDVTGVFPLASVAAMQGRIAMWHSLGDAVTPLDIKQVSSNVFTSPEVATVGITQSEVDAGKINVNTAFLSLDGNARSKMQSFRDGFIKLFCLPTSGIIVGGVVVAPRASELIHVLTLAVAQRITVDQLSNTFTVYPSISGSVAEVARRLHRRVRVFSDS